MKILVTGGAGFIGSHIADALLERGHEVVIMDDLSSGNPENVPAKALFLEADIRDTEAVGRAFVEHRFDAVCHQAAQTSVSVSTREPLRDAQVNVLGSLNLLEAAREHGTAHFVFASTGGAIYGEVPEDRRAGEAWTPHPISPYACAKLSFETYLRAYGHEHGTPYTILRYGNVYGPRQDPHGEAGVVAIFSQRLVAGDPVRINARVEVGDPGCIRDYVYVQDVVRANLFALEGKATDRVMNVGTGIGTSTLQLAEALERALGVEATKEYGARRPGDLERSVLEPNDRLLALGASTSIDEGIGATAHWFRGRFRDRS